MIIVAMSQKVIATTEPASSGTNSVEQVGASEYETLLAQVKKEHLFFVAKANKFIPRMAEALERTGKSVEQIRDRIYTDLEGIWAHGTITNALPSKFKDKVKAENAKHRQSEPEVLLTENEQEPEQSWADKPIRRKTPENVEVINYHRIVIQLHTGKNKGAEPDEVKTIIFEKPHIVVTNRPHSLGNGGQLQITYHEEGIHLPKSNYIAYNAPMPIDVFAKIHGLTKEEAEAQIFRKPQPRA
jgi:hypothetical protein